VETRTDWLRRQLTILAGTSLAIAGLATLGGWLGRWLWLGELASHFRVQYFWIFVLGGLLLVAARRFRLAAAAALFALLNLATILPLYWPAAGPPTAGRRLRAVSLNVYSANDRHDDVVAFLSASRADFIVLLEVTAEWRDLFDALQAEYPFGRFELRSDSFGMALLSRLPAEEFDVVFVGSARLPSIVARYIVDGRDLTLIGTHPLPPGSSARRQMRDEQFAGLAALVRERPGPVILMGDLNVTSWSASFDLLVAGTRLHDSRRGFGVQPSWPAWLAIGRIPIDHCLVTPEVTIVDRQIGPDVGSDHYPVVVDLALAGAGTAAVPIAIPVRGTAP
jgi:endonuclease/exonuclease/phosphatase (EEP) superfamily protein YafD